MAEDGFAVLDGVGAASAHIAGWSMGGMIVQAMAIRNPDRIASMTSVMTAPGSLTGERDPDVVAAFMAPPATTREEAAERHLAGLRAWGSPAAFDVDRMTVDADRLVPLEFGQATAAAVPRGSSGDRQGHGHDYPPQYWDQLVDLISAHALGAPTTF